jgi:hypothetical protein
VETLLIMLLMPMPALTDRIHDPAPGVWNSKTEVRNLECTRMTQARAHELYPGTVPEPAPRISGNLMEVDALACTPRIIRAGERPARDEVILSSLSGLVREITEVASAHGDANTRWHVDAYYPEPRVASKISVAARTDLAERGHKVSDRVPLLAAGDLDVMRSLPAKDAYGLACTRFYAQKSLGEDDAFLAIAIVDDRETQLHAGVCRRGQWQWVR